MEKFNEFIINCASRYFTKIVVINPFNDFYFSTVFKSTQYFVFFPLEFLSVLQKIIKESL